MATYYCSHAGCGSKITYEAVKPSHCPKCRQPIRDAMAILTQAAALPVAPRTAAPSYQPPAPPPVRERSAGAIAHINPDQDTDGSEGTYDVRQARQLARQLAASIDPSTIQVEAWRDADERMTPNDWGFNR